MPPFLSLLRPSPLQMHLDQTYLFATTAGGQFRPHRGVEFNVPPGAPIVASADGVVVRTTPPEDGNRLFLDHDATFDGWRMTTAYVHCRALHAREGQRLRAGDPIGEAGDLGRATNTHLHFEVLLRRDGEPLDDARPSNPELWLRPVRPGDGAFALVDPPPGAILRGIHKPLPPETPFTHAEAPHPDLVNDTPGSGWLVVSDVAAGEWDVVVIAEARRRGLAIAVQAGRLALVAS